MQVKKNEQFPPARTLRMVENLRNG